MKISWCIILCLLTAACSSSRNSESAEAPSKNTALWQGRPLTIDGNDNDWIKPLPFSIKEENISYAITNDNQNLYILVTTRSPQEQQKIIQGGMSVWVNTKGEKTNGDAVGIGYPLDEHNDPDRNLMAEAQPQRYQNNKPVTLEDKKGYALYGFNKDSSIQNYTYGDSNSVGVVMRLDYNTTGDLVYEAAIPLQRLYPGHSATASFAAKTVAVGIFIQGLPPTTRGPRQGGGGPGVGIGGGLGMGTFGSGMGLGLSIGSGAFGGGGRRGSNQKLYEEADIWQTVQLAGH